MKFKCATCFVFITSFAPLCAQNKVPLKDSHKKPNLDQVSKLNQLNVNDPVVISKITSSALPNDPRLKILRERMLKLQLRNAELHQQVISGSKDPLAGFRKAYANAEQGIITVKQLASRREEATNPVLHKQLTKELFQALQPIGRYLAPAQSQRFEHKLSAAQNTKIETLRAAFNDLDGGADLPADTTKSLTVLSLAETYTLLHLKTPIILKAPPGADIYLQGQTGGVFENDLPVQHLIADKQGQAVTTWRSLGYAIGPSEIQIYSPQCAAPAQCLIYVVDLKLRHLPSFKELQKKYHKPILQKFPLSPKLPKNTKP